MGLFDRFRKRVTEVASDADTNALSAEEDSDEARAALQQAATESIEQNQFQPATQSGEYPAPIGDEDEEEWFLDCYDEMHNHVLASEPRIIPQTKTTFKKPVFETPCFLKFKEIEADSFEEFKTTVSQVAKERGFDVGFSGEFDRGKTEDKAIVVDGSNRRHDYNADKAFTSTNELLFECKFKVQGLCPSQCMSKANDIKSRREAYEVTFLAE